MILIVDDNSENIFSLKILLEKNSYKVDSAASGEEALRKVLKHSYSLIILDVQMPGMDGFEVAEALAGSSKSREIPIIFLSAVNTHKKFITKGYESGGIDYVTKPFDPDILLLKVKTFTRLYDQQRELGEVQKVLRREIEYKTEAEAGLNQSVEELRSILQSVQQIAFTAKPDGTIEFVNNQWYDYARNKNEFPETSHDSISVRECFDRAIETGQPQAIETCMRRLDQQDFRYFLLGITPVRKGDTIVKWVGTFTDIDEQKMASQVLELRVEQRTLALQEMNKELEARNNELQQFASVASHDLQEPLRKIQVFSAIIKDKFIKEGEASSYLERVISASDRMRALINDLLNYSGLSAESLAVEVNLNTIIDTILVDFELLIKSRQAILNISKLPEIEAIPSQMHQVFQNLIGNALKFAKDDVPLVIDISSDVIAEKSFDAPVDQDGQFCRITIKDNGIGFNQEYVGRIFTIFQRLSGQKKYAGTGIGLAIVKKVVEKHNGLIAAKGIENEGAIFTLILPLKQTATIEVLQGVSNNSKS